MNSQTKRKLILITLGISLILLNVFSYHTENDRDYTVVDSDISSDINLKSSKSWSNLTFIHIDDSGASGNGTWSWAEGESWCSKIANVYVIENVTIDATGNSFGILIGNSSVYFTIRNCTVFNSGSGSLDAGIKLINTNNGTLTENNCTNNRIGIYLDNCANITISNNFLNDNIYGLRLESCNTNNKIEDNDVNDNINNKILSLPISGTLDLNKIEFTCSKIDEFYENR